MPDQATAAAAEVRDLADKLRRDLEAAADLVSRQAGTTGGRAAAGELRAAAGELDSVLKKGAADLEG